MISAVFWTTDQLLERPMAREASRWRAWTREVGTSTGNDSPPAMSVGTQSALSSSQLQSAGQSAFVVQASGGQVEASPHASERSSQLEKK